TDNVLQITRDLDGNAVTATDAFSTLTYTYDQHNRPATEDNGGTPNTPHVVLTFGYDPAGNFTSVSDTIDGQLDATVTYTPNALNRLAQITQTGPGVHDKRIDVTYNAIGQVATINFASDLAGTQQVVDAAYSYDSLNRLTDLAYTHQGTTVASYRYA